MIGRQVALATRAAGRPVLASQSMPTTRSFAAAAVRSTAPEHRVVIIGGGSAGLAISHQLLRSGKFSEGEIAVVDPAEWHHYQPGWTLVGGGLKTKEELRQPMRSLLDPKFKFYNENVRSFSPEENSITLGNGDKVNYENLVVVPGININYGSIKGLSDALADPHSMVSSIYGYDTCDKVFRTVKRLQKGVALFTQPNGVIKCAGAPQKMMWMALDHWKRAGLYNNTASSPIKIKFATGLPVMFGVPKYSAKLDQLRKERGVEGLFQHDLLEINGSSATFALPDGTQVTKDFDLLHAVPKMGPHAFVKNSGLGNEAGYVDVDEKTTRHTKYPNIWSVGDASNLPTSKTVAAITSQAQVLVQNLLRCMEGKEPETEYDGYTSCPLVTEYGKVLLAEFKYGGQPKETFGGWLGIDQAVPRRAFYHMKKDFFPWVYSKFHVKGTWGGPSGWIRNKN